MCDVFTVRHLKDPALLALADGQLSVLRPGQDVRVLHKDPDPLLDEPPGAVSREVRRAGPAGLYIGLVGQRAASLARGLRVAHGAVVAVVRNLHKADPAAEICHGLLQLIRPVAGGEEAQLREIAAQRAVVHEREGVVEIKLAKLLRLLPPDPEPYVVQFDLAAGLKKLHLCPGPLRKRDALAQVRVVPGHGPAVAVAPDAVHDALRIVAEELLHPEEAVGQDHVQPDEMIEMRVREQQVRLRAPVVLHPLYKRRRGRAPVEPVDHQRGAEVAAHDGPVAAPVVRFAGLKPGNK